MLCFFLSGATGFRNHTLVSQPIIPQSQTRDPLSWRSGAGDEPSGRCGEVLVCEVGEPEGSRSKTNPKGRAQVPGASSCQPEKERSARVTELLNTLHLREERYNSQSCTCVLRSNALEQIIKGTVHTPKIKFYHNFFTLMSFSTNINLFSVLKTKYDILKNVGNQIVAGSH